MHKRKYMEVDSNNNKKLVKHDRNTHKRRDNIDDDPKLTLDTLNIDCFLMILDHLDSQSLMSCCDVNKEFRANICAYEHIFKSKPFEMDEFVDIEPILKEYGRFICKWDVNEYNILFERFSMKFNRLMTFVIEYMVPGNLTELTLRFGIVKVDNDLFARAVPYFCNVKRFTFSACGSSDFSRAQEHVLNEIIGNARQLTSLDVRYLRTAGNWFRFSHLKQLQHLTFSFVELTTFAPFRQFIQNRPTLKTLVLSIDNVHHQHICRLAAKYVPDLVEFQLRNSYLQLPHGDDFEYYDRETVEKNDTENESDESDEENDDDEEDGSSEEDEDDEEDDDNEDDTIFEDSDDQSDFEWEESDSDIDVVRNPDFIEINDHHTRWKEVYKGLREMNCLKNTWLKSHFGDCSDLYDTIKMLASKNMVNYLTIQVNPKHDFIQHENQLNEPFPRTFTALKTLRLISPSYATQPFLRHFIPALPSLTKCILDMEPIDRSVQDIIETLIEAATNLQILGLKMPSKNLDHLLYMKLIGIKVHQMTTSTKTKPLEIYISSWKQRAKCLAELKNRYDEQIIAIKIKSFMTWERDPL